MNQNNQFTIEQQDILVGTLLGDGKLVFDQNMIKASYAAEQGSVHKSYLYHLWDIFKDICVHDEPVKYDKFDKRSGKTHTSYYFSTLSLSALAEYARLFYVINDDGGKVKVVPYNIKDLLTPRALAYWIIADPEGRVAKLKLVHDGQYVKRGGLTLCTDGFTLAEINLLTEVLETKYGFKCTLHKKNQSFRIYISGISLPKLRKIVTPYMHHSFLYKLDK